MVIGIYIGQTSRALKKRVKENNKAVSTLYKNSLLDQHHDMLHQQESILECVDIIQRSATDENKDTFFFFEEWHSVRETNSISEHISFTNIIGSPSSRH